MQRFDLVSTSRSMGRSPTSRGAQHTVPPTPSSPVADNHHFLSGIPAQAAVLNDMAAAIRQRDVCLVGKAGEGKSAVMRQLAKQLATTLHIFPLFKVGVGCVERENICKRIIHGKDAAHIVILVI